MQHAPNYGSAAPSLPSTLPGKLGLALRTRLTKQSGDLPEAILQHRRRSARGSQPPSVKPWPVPCPAFPCGSYWHCVHVWVWPSRGARSAQHLDLDVRQPFMESPRMLRRRDGQDAEYRQARGRRRALHARLLSVPVMHSRSRGHADRPRHLAARRGRQPLGNDAQSFCGVYRPARASWLSRGLRRQGLGAGRPRGRRMDSKSRRPAVRVIRGVL